MPMRVMAAGSGMSSVGIMYVSNADSIELLEERGGCRSVGIMHISNADSIELLEERGGMSQCWHSCSNTSL